MALTAIEVINTDHFAKGGVKILSIGTYDATASMTSAANHTVTHVPAADVVIIEFEKETCKFTSSTSQEKGLAMTSVSVEAYIPKLASLTFLAIEAMKGEAMYAKVELWDGVSYILGWDAVLGGEGVLGTDFALFLESVEADSGAALADQNGVTLKLSGIQGEEPRQVAA